METNRVGKNQEMISIIGVSVYTSTAQCRTHSNCLIEAGRIATTLGRIDFR